MAPSPSLRQLIETVQADTEGGDPLDQLAQASQLVGELSEVGDALLGHFVEQCREAGRSWTEISTSLGVTKQAAHKRYSVGAPTFERFTPRARAVLEGSAEEARALGHGFIGTEHLLLGMFAPGSVEGLAGQVLMDAGISREACVEKVRELTSKGDVSPDGRLPMTPKAVEALRCAVEEALLLGHNYIGTEHLLLGLFRDSGGVAAKVLASLGATYEDTQSRVAAKLEALTKK